MAGALGANTEPVLALELAATAQPVLLHSWQGLGPRRPTPLAGGALPTFRLCGRYRRLVLEQLPSAAEERKTVSPTALGLLQPRKAKSLPLLLLDQVLDRATCLRFDGNSASQLRGNGIHGRCTARHPGRIVPSCHRDCSVPSCWTTTVHRLPFGAASCW
jgi:hypothetical protein